VLEDFVNGLLGLADPAINLAFYGVNVVKLAEAFEVAGELLGRRELVDE